MYLHVVLFIFLLCLFVLSLEQAQNEIQSQRNSDETEQELHPGNNKSIHAGIEQGLREQHLSPNSEEINSAEPNQKTILLHENNLIKPSCSFSDHFYRKGFNNDCSKSKSSSKNESAQFIIKELENSVLEAMDKNKLQLVPVYKDLLKIKKLIENYEKSEHTESTLKWQHNSALTTENISSLPEEHVTFSNTYYKHFDENFQNVTDISGINAFVKNTGNNQNRLSSLKPFINNYSFCANNEADSDGGILNKKLIKHLSLKDNSRIRYNQILKKYFDQMNEENLSYDNYAKNMSSQYGPTAPLKSGKFKNLSEQSSYYVSASKHNNFKINHTDPSDNKSEYNTLNFHPVVVPFLLTDNILKNLLIIKNSESKNRTLNAYEPGSWVLEYKRNSIAPTGSVTEKNVKSTTSYGCSNLKTVTASREFTELINASTITGHAMTRKPIINSTCYLLRNTTSSKLNTNKQVVSSEERNNVSEEILMRILQNFFKIVSDYQNTQNTRDRNVNHSKAHHHGKDKSNEFTLTFIADPDCLNIGLPTESGVNNNEQNPVPDNNYNVKKQEDDIPLKVSRSVSDVNAFHESIDKDEQNKDTIVISSDGKDVTFEELKNGTESEQPPSKSNKNVVKFNIYYKSNLKSDKDKVINKTNPLNLRNTKEKGDRLNSCPTNKDNQDDQKNKYNKLLSALLEKLRTRFPTEQNTIGRCKKNFKTKITITKCPINNVPMFQSSTPDSLLDQDPFSPVDLMTTKTSETSDDYFNPFIYGNKKRMPFIPIAPAIKILSNKDNNDVEEGNKGVIKGKVYITGPEDLTPDKIHIMNPEVLRTIQDSTGPKDVHFILDDCDKPDREIKSNRKGKQDAFPGQALSESMKFINKATPANFKSKENNPHCSNECLLKQLKSVNDRLTKLRDNINKRLQFSQSSDVVSNYHCGAK